MFDEAPIQIDRYFLPGSSAAAENIYGAGHPGHAGIHGCIAYNAKNNKTKNIIRHLEEYSFNFLWRGMLFVVHGLKMDPALKDHATDWAGRRKNAVWDLRFGNAGGWYSADKISQQNFATETGKGSVKQANFYVVRVFIRTGIKFV